MAVTSKDVARLAGVSPATVSLVLHGKGNISEGTRQKVLQAAETLGLPLDRAGRVRKVPLIQMVVYKRHGRVVGDTPFFEELIQSVSQQAYARGYQFVLNYFYGNQDPAEQLRGLRGMGCVGIILLATEMQLEDIALFETLNVPLVLLDNSLMQKTYSTVAIDNQRGVYWAVEYLIECGHTHIGYLSGNADIRNFRERREGFLSALRLLPAGEGKRPPKPYILSMGTTEQGAFDDMTKLLATDPVLPTAFFADNDHIAKGCIRALHKFGYRVPEEISVISFDDMPFAAEMDPPLTTMAVPGHAMGNLAMQHLAAIVEGRSNNARLRLLVLPELVERASVRRL